LFADKHQRRRDLLFYFPAAHEHDLPGEAVPVLCPVNFYMLAPSLWRTPHFPVQQTSKNQGLALCR
jgi:hypothetical protein